MFCKFKSVVVFFETYSALHILDHLQITEYLSIDFSFFNLLKKFSDKLLISEIEFLFVTEKERNIASFRSKFLLNGTSPSP